MNEAMRRRGRRKVAPGEVRALIFSIRHSADERAMLKKAADGAGIDSASDWACEVLLVATAKS